MKVNETPGCCAVKILSNFGHTIQQNTNPDLNEIDSFLKQQIKWYSDKSLLIFVNQEQNKKIRPILISNGFRCVSKFWHSSHNNYVFYYIKNPVN